MFSLSPRYITLLREASIDTYLPMINVPVVKNEHFMHICKDSTEDSEWVPFIDAVVDPDCASCVAAPQWELWDLFHDPLAYIIDILMFLETAEPTARNAKEGTEDDPSKVGYALSLVREIIERTLPACNAPEVLMPLLKDLGARAQKVDETIVSFLSSKEAKVIIEKYEESYKTFTEWDSTNNALLFVKKSTKNYALALAEAYGIEVAPGKFLAQGPAIILDYLSESTVSSPLYVDGPVPTSVLCTMGSLWEPDSETALGDATKVLDAAWMLTPESTYT